MLVLPCRLGMLESQCRSWPHALAAVAYLPRLAGSPPADQPELGNYTEAAVAAAQQQFAEFHARMGQEPGAGWTRLPCVSRLPCGCHGSVRDCRSVSFLLLVAT